MSFPDLAPSWSFLLLGDASSPNLVEAAAAWATALTTMVAAYYAYRTLYHMRKSSHEDAVRNVRDRTLKDIKPAYERTKKCLQAIKELSEDDRREPKHQQHIKESLNAWEEVAIGVATGVYDDQLLYDFVGKFIQGFYCEVSWVIRTCRLGHRHYFDQLEGLIDRVNDIECTRYEINRLAIARLRRLYVPRDVLKLLRTLPANYLDRQRFESDLEQRAQERGASIDFYKPTIFKETRAKLPVILPLNQDKRQKLAGKQGERLTRSLLGMFNEISKYTGGRYPDLNNKTLPEWVEEREAACLCRFIAFNQGRDLDSRDPEIVGYVALEDLSSSGRWENSFADLSNRTVAMLQHALDRKTCIVIKELYVLESYRRTRAGKGLYRRLLRRAIQAVEERHFGKDPDQRKWALLALVRPAAANPHDSERQKKIIEAEGKIIEAEGGKYVGLDEPEGMPLDVYLFGQEFKSGKVPPGGAKRSVKPR